MSLSANASSPIPASSAPLLQAEGVTVRFDACERPFDVVRDVSFTLHPGRTLCLVGESGCGKSMTALSLLRLIPEPGRLAAGRILFEGRDLAELSESAMERVRGRDIGMIFQEPMTSLNPVIRVGEQVAEPLMRHLRLSKKAALADNLFTRKSFIPNTFSIPFTTLIIFSHLFNLFFLSFVLLFFRSFFNFSNFYYFDL